MRLKWILPVAMGLSLVAAGCGTSSSGGTGAGNQASCSEDYPTEPIRMIVAGPAGAGSDTFARKVSRIIKTHDLSPQPFQVDNVTGGGEVHAVRELADGDNYTIITEDVAVRTGVMRGGTGVELKKLTPISRLMVYPTVWMTHTSRPWQTPEEFIDYTKNHPGQVTVGFGSIGSTDHLTFYQVAQELGLDVSYVPHESGKEGMVDLAGGNIDISSGQPSEARQFIEAGKVRPLLVFYVEPDQYEVLRGVPTGDDIGVSVPEITYRGFSGSPGMCPEAVSFIEETFEKVLQTQEWKEFAKKNGNQTAYLSSEEYTNFLNELDSTLRNLVQEMGLER